MAALAPVGLALLALLARLGLLVMLALLAPASHAQQSPRPPAGGTVSARRAESPIAVDGRLDEAAWGSAATVSLDHEVRPRENLPAELRTSCRVTFDEERLYIGCEALDPDASSIRAWHVARDQIDGQDFIGITLDPFGDARGAYRFRVTALGAQYDAVVTPGASSPENVTWDGAWYAAGRLVATGFVVELAIPFRTIHAPAASGQPWAISLARVQPRDRTIEVRNTPVDRGNACELCQLTALEGITIESARGGVLVAPTVTTSRVDRSRSASPGIETGGWRTEVGADALVPLGGTLRLSVTANPDFSHVDVDAVQLDANARFALAFPERRPFFLESADLFQTREQIVFTRSIADPLAGVKAAGKMGHTTFAALAALDEITNLLLPGSQGSRQATLDGRSGVLALRGRRDVGDASTVGAFATARIGADYANHVVAADAALRPFSAVEVHLLAAGSVTRYPDSLALGLDQPAGWFPGGELRGSVRLAPRDWVVHANADIRTRGLRLDAGFQPRAAVRNFDAGIRRRFWGDGRYFSDLSVSAGTWRSATESGAMLDGGWWLGGDFRGPRESSLSAYYNHGLGFRAGDRLFRLHNVYWNAQLRPQDRITLRLEGWTGSGIEFATVREARELHLAPGARLRLGRHLELDLSYQRARYTAGDTVLLTEHGAEVRGAWYFTPHMSLRVIAQRHGFARESAVLPSGIPANQRGEMLQAIYSLRLTPQTLFVAGYATTWSGTSTVHRPALEPVERGLFVKGGYAWSF